MTLNTDFPTSSISHAAYSVLPEESLPPLNQPSLISRICSGLTNTILRRQPPTPHAALPLSKITIESALQPAIPQEVGINTTYAEVIKRQKNLCPQEPYIPSQTYNPEDFIKRQQKLLMEVSELTVVDGAGKILTSSEPKEGVKSVMGLNTCDDLGLISGRQDSGTCFASEINRTHTVAGYLFFKGRISRPTANLDLIKNRQALTKLLAHPDYADLLTETDDDLEMMKANELHMLGFENSKLALPGRVDKLFWKYQIRWLDEKANASSYAVTFNAGVETSKAIVATGIQTAAIIVLPAYSLSLTGALPDEMSTFLADYAKRFAGSSGPLYAMASLVPSDAVKGTMGALAGAIASISIKTQWKWVYTDLKMELMLHKKMLAVSRYYRSMKNIYQTFKSFPDITQKLEHFQKLEEFFKDKSLKKLFGALESRTFNGESGLFFQRGNVLFPWRQLEEPSVREQFRKAITAIAEIDTVISTAKLVTEYADERVKFCFPEFIENSETPAVELTDYWHPVVGKEKAVVNSIALGETYEVPNIIITGPNAGGKSTSLRSITSAVVLGQSLGIAPALAMKFTPFSRITSSMQTTDNVQTGDSLFQAQTNFISELDRDMGNAPPRYFGISALDEIFTGTRQEEGAELAQASAKKLGDYRNGITMFATHFQNVPELANQGGRFTNYKVTAQLQDNRFVSPYTLVEGVSNQYLGFEIAAQKGLSQEILNNARLQREARNQFSSNISS